MGQEMGQGSATAVGCWGIRRRHSRGLAGLGAGKEAEDSHTRGCAHPHVPWGLQPASLICSNHTEAICIGERFIFSFYTQHFINSLPELPDSTAKCLRPSRLHRVRGGGSREIPEPRESQEDPERCSGTPACQDSHPQLRQGQTSGTKQGEPRIAQGMACRRGRLVLASRRLLCRTINAVTGQKSLYLQKRASPAPGVERGLLPCPAHHARLKVPNSLCPAPRPTRLGLLGSPWSSSLLQLVWALVSQYLILFRNELIHCFKNILRHCEAIISVLNGIKAGRADAFTKAEENIYWFFSNN